MKNNFQEESISKEKKSGQAQPDSLPARASVLTKFISALLGMGLGEPLIKLGANLFSVIAIALVVVMSRSFYQQAGETPNGEDQAQSLIDEAVEVNSIPVSAEAAIEGISRNAQLRTTIPSRPREELSTYLVQDGDTVFGIAEKFGLQPETILWGNYNLLLDDPHSLKPGQELFILPVDGVYWEWLGGIPFGEWANFYGVNAADIIEYPGNNIDPNTVGDYENANIKTGTWLIIPNGKRDFVSWSAPLGVTRENPASARVLGAGACDPVSGGAVGYGAFVYPTNKHYLSGFDWSPKTNHNGLDFAGNEGEAVYASDAGVIVYAGWNDYGYGNMVMVDHGNGFQSLYAHLSALNVGCGQSVGQGQVIGAVGSTGRSSGPHLHFEIMAGVKVNPWDYLPPP
ncbi:MAG: M23 family metallopeptidase [Anaerolineales bacterium]|nr:M23 family metallopeptidase [Anaerolineales bacterium]MCB9144297.1 M23 family metallopeptidase [Anaerolineales bacterium]